MSASALIRRDPGIFDDGRAMLGTHPYFSASLERGLAILESFDERHALLSLGEIASRLGMSRSTAYRYVSTLRALGFLLQDAPRERYRLALGVTTLGCAAMNAMSLAVQAQSVMQMLARQTEFPINLGELDGPEVVLLERVKGRSRGASVGAPALGPRGARLPAHCTALGKLLLAMLPDKPRRDLLAEMVLERHAPNTLSSRRILREELAQIQDRELAICDEEYRTGRVAIAAAVRDERGYVRAALGLSAAASRVTAENLAGGLGAHLLSAADEISARLGYRRVDERAGDAW